MLIEILAGHALLWKRMQCLNEKELLSLHPANKNYMNN
jgi:hypothetical protein